MKRIFIVGFVLLIWFLPTRLVDAEDNIPPGDIEYPPKIMKVGDGWVSLEWERAQDNTRVTGYIVYYGTHSLFETSKQKEAVTGEVGTGNTDDDISLYGKTKRVGNVKETTIRGLENGITYYFAIVAVDSAGNESEYFSPEAGAIPNPTGEIEPVILPGANEFSSGGYTPEVGYDTQETTQAQGNITDTIIPIGMVVITIFIIIVAFIISRYFESRTRQELKEIAERLGLQYIDKASSIPIKRVYIRRIFIFSTISLCYGR